ncbi:MAG: hypothetical protein ACR2L2_10455 [Acidobacteriota bacterium]
MLSVHVFYRLDDFLTAESKELSDRMMGTYYWSRKLPDNRYALQIYEDESGKQLKDGPLFYRFDHVKDCKCQK